MQVDERHDSQDTQSSDGAGSGIVNNDLDQRTDDKNAEAASNRTRHVSTKQRLKTSWE